MLSKKGKVETPKPKCLLYFWLVLTLFRMKGEKLKKEKHELAKTVRLVCFNSFIIILFFLGDLIF